MATLLINQLRPVASTAKGQKDQDHHKHGQGSKPKQNRQQLDRVSGKHVDLVNYLINSNYEDYQHTQHNDS